LVKITELIDDFELSQQIQEWKKQYIAIWRYRTFIS